MSKRPSIKKQIVDALNSQIRFGNSKYEAKQQQIAAAKAAGVSGWNPARVEGIYSIETMKTYRKAALAFGEWVKEKHGCRWLAEAKEHVSEYIQEQISKGQSAWTIHTARPALRKLFQDYSLASEIKIPIRRKDQIKRSRGQKAMDKKFSVERNRELVDFSRATGLRRHELRAIKAENVYRADGRLWAFVEQGKGGRPRTVPVLEAMEQRVEEIISTKRSTEKMFPRIPCRADIHGYRREYANALYVEYAGEKYDPANKNEDVMMLVSAALGHNRIDVISRNYLEVAA